MLEGLAVADMVIEAIPEDLELKRDAFRRLDAVAAADDDPGHQHELAARWRASLRRRRIRVAWSACTSSTRCR